MKKGRNHGRGCRTSIECLPHPRADKNAFTVAELIPLTGLRNERYIQAHVGPRRDDQHALWGLPLYRLRKAKLDGGEISTLHWACAAIFLGMKPVLVRMHGPTASPGGRLRESDPPCTLPRN